jgi:ABC-2 type transport system permease protein
VTYWHQIFAVARWEFLRFVKLKQQMISFAVMLGVGLAFGAAGYFIAKSRAKPVKVALVAPEKFGGTLPAVEGVAWQRPTTDEAALTRQLAAKTIDGYVVVLSPDSARIVLREKAKWPTRVREAFTAARRQAAMQQSGITAEQLAALQASMSFATTYTKQKRDTDGADEAVALGILFFVFAGVMSGAGYLFTGITGEKQMRVTDAILSAITPAAWLDGKILGQLAVALVGIVNSVVSIGVLGGGALLLFGDKIGPIDIPLPGAAVVAQVIVLVLLGLVLWYALLGAFTSTIDDPNDSMRSTVLLLPMLPMYLAYLMKAKSDTALAVGLSTFPLTSYAALPVRLATTTPAWWEFPVAVALLLGAIWLARLLGGRLFAAGVQMYGKEPSLREMFAAMRTA